MKLHVLIDFKKIPWGTGNPSLRSSSLGCRYASVSNGIFLLLLLLSDASSNADNTGATNTGVILAYLLACLLAFPFLFTKRDYMYFWLRDHLKLSSHEITC